MKTPWGETGYITYKRTYSRKMSNGDMEEFPDTIERVISAAKDQLDCGFSDKEQDEIRDILLGLKGMVAGRFLWQLGTKTVDKLGLASLQNCATVRIDQPIDPFTWAMDMLMLGSGVGFNLQREHVSKLPMVKPVTLTRVDNSSADFIVPDTREGWVELLRRTLQAHFCSGVSFSFSVHCIRSKGSPIKGFGGTASGPEELVQGITWISELLNKRSGAKPTPVDCLDIMNIIGFIVVSGNVRRSAQLAIGDHDDIDYLRAKRWDLGDIPNWRAMSNNSVFCKDTQELPEEFWEGYKGNGEPYGLINLDLSRNVGRLFETKYPDPNITGYNPCAEQSLESNETCCLAEVFLPNIHSQEEFDKVVSYLYRICKHSLRLPCHQKDTEEVVHRNMRMGIGVTGVAQASTDQLLFLDQGYTTLRKLDREYSKKMGWPTSIKLTCVKPSGTLSLLAGVTPGAHPGYSEYFIRRIRIASNSPLVKMCSDYGYHVEPVRNFDGTNDQNTVVVSFPCKYPKSTVFAKDVSAVSQLATVGFLQCNWADNSVSCTIYYKNEELEDIKEYLRNNYIEGIKTCSFLRHSDHGFDQAPFEEITEETYNTLKLGVREITGIDVEEGDFELEECSTGACPVK